MLPMTRSVHDECGLIDEIGYVDCRYYRKKLLYSRRLEQLGDMNGDKDMAILQKGDCIFTSTQL